jgi:predicted dehydrogenase
VWGANDAVRVAVIGLGGKGSQHAEVFRKLAGARVAALCDVDPERLAKVKAPFDRDREAVFAATDPRRVLERNDVDAVVIATPNHWHALLGVWACEAGKDVYVEKPVSHNVWEGRQLIKAAQKHERIMQAGTQYRSDPGLRQVADYIREGHLGKVQWGHVVWYERRPSIGQTAPHRPTFLDYDLWCGPAPAEPLERPRLHYDWHWVWATGDGDLGNSGIHAFDLCRWLVGYDHLPARILGLGGRLGYEDAGQTPNTQLTVLDYQPAPILIENRNLPMERGVEDMDRIRGIREGVIVQGEYGYFAGMRSGGWVFDNEGKRVKQFLGDGGAQHTANFIAAVRERKPALLRAPIVEGHLSSAGCHLGNISYRLGRHEPLSAARQATSKVPLSNATLDRLEQHLRANQVDLAKTPLSLGPWLTFDATSETITAVGGASSGDARERAQALARGSYRAPFVLRGIA